MAQLIRECLGEQGGKRQRAGHNSEAAARAAAAAAAPGQEFRIWDGNWRDQKRVVGKDSGRELGDEGKRTEQNRSKPSFFLLDIFVTV